MVHRGTRSHGPSIATAIGSTPSAPGPILRPEASEASAPGAAEVQPQGQSVRAQGQRCPPKADLEYQKQVAKKLLDALDEESLWRLARELQRRGLIRAEPGGLEAVHQAPQAPRSAGTGGDGDMGGQGARKQQKNTLNLGAALAASAAQEKAPAVGAPAAREGAAAREPRGRAVKGQAPEEDQIEDSKETTLIIRNLPPYFDQKSTQEWVDSKGYRNLYDFLLWFPAKKTSRLNTSSYAFVNFQDPLYSQRFRQEYHLARFPLFHQEDEQGRKQQWPLSIAVAKVQGFTENYIRFHHLTDDKSPTLCQPYFAQDAVDRLSQEARAAAAAAATTAPLLDTLQDGPCTTLIIRNLPYSLDTQDGARQWLDSAGFDGDYNFFLYLPPKRRRPETTHPGGPPQGLGYAFVNFKTTDTSMCCTETLNGRALEDGDPVLNVVAARVQGLEECIGHFSSLGDSGRVSPWVDPDAARTRPPRQYQ